MVDWLTNTILKTGVADILTKIDDATDHRVMSRQEALRFLEEMSFELDVRIDWVREAIKQSEQQDERTKAESG
jgi:hypothetical protein